jgi:16S rRNA (guanine527-N7)-methyltransferase
MTTGLPNPEALWLSTLNWHPNDYQQRSFQVLYSALVEINQHINLTRITTPEDFWEKHLWDALQGISPWLSRNTGQTLATAKQGLSSQDTFAVMDIGTGGGFPGLPVALAQPHWQVSLLDSTQKKIAAIKSIAEKLGLSNVHLLADRAEQVGHQPLHREAFDLVLIRAVGPTNTCAEYALPLLKPGGQAVLYRGHWEPAEEMGLNAVLPRLGGKLMQVRKVETPMTHGIRHYVDVQKRTQLQTNSPEQSEFRPKLHSRAANDGGPGVFDTPL